MLRLFLSFASVSSFVRYLLPFAKHDFPFCYLLSDIPLRIRPELLKITVTDGTLYLNSESVGYFLPKTFFGIGDIGAVSLGGLLRWTRTIARMTLEVGQRWTRCLAWFIRGMSNFYQRASPGTSQRLGAEECGERAQEFNDVADL